MTTLIDAIRISGFGGRNVLSLDRIDLPAPGPGEIQLRHLAIGLNFIDIYHRKGVFAAPLSLPSGLGVEGVGEVTLIGDGVAGIAPGDRVAYVGGPPGAYATARNLPAARAITVPDGIDSATMAAMIFKGLTAEYLIHRCVAVRPGDRVLFHAAAGGVGSIACQWLKAIGAEVIGTVGSGAKADAARRNGCDHVIVTGSEDVAASVRRITGGKGVRVAYDSVGADTFAGSLDSLAPRGTLVSFGESSGPVAPLAVASLGAKGSLFLTRPSIAHYTADRAEYKAAAQRLFAAMADGTLAPPQVTTYPLADAARAQDDMENRRTQGSVVLLP
ncbi:quinone oxidoreductase family protein [Paracoccus sediminis]|uniref:NADPH2:quinone reductase n=1 Tax=Paracoccus sediminis TaxID=1214787 RepID=A0A238WMY8_9RHOB|nr:quinone oxidoreductase [Paracoccus sediminis]SNR47905.1 NADPH2:quinone reductase [Paracoccus sediminis]